MTEKLWLNFYAIFVSFSTNNLHIGSIFLPSPEIELSLHYTTTSVSCLFYMSCLKNNNKVIALHSE